MVPCCCCQDVIFNVNSAFERRIRVKGPVADWLTKSTGVEYSVENSGCYDVDVKNELVFWARYTNLTTTFAVFSEPFGGGGANLVFSENAATVRQWNALECDARNERLFGLGPQRNPTNNSAYGVERMNYDGTGRMDITTFTHSVTTIASNDHIAYDPATDRVYYSETIDNPGFVYRIRRMNSDGTGNTVLYSSTSGQSKQINSLDLDIINRKVIWTELSPSVIYVADIDCAGPINIWTGGVGDVSIRCARWSHKDQKVYYTSQQQVANAAPYSWNRCDIDGGNLERLVTVPSSVTPVWGNAPPPNNFRLQCGFEYTKGAAVAQGIV
jgi:hypothetical protein